MKLFSRLTLLFLFLLPSVLHAEDAFFETGSVVVNDSIDRGNWESVTLRETYTNPVVIVGPVTHNNDNSLSARVRNVTATGFEVGFQSPCESAGRAAGGVACPPGGSWRSETIRYWVVEEGAWEFPDGTLIEAGQHTTSTVRSGIGGNNADTIAFRQGFSAPPAILHSVNTFNDPDWITSTVYGSGNNTGTPPDANDMNLALEGAEVTASHGAEVIGWVAIESGSGSNNGHAYVAGRTAGRDVDRHNDECQGIGFGGFSSPPDALVSHNTMNGTNGGWVRYCGPEVTAGGVNVHIDEDQVRDSERTGIEELVSVFAFDADGSGQITRPDTFCSSVTALFCDDFDEGNLASNGWTVDSFRRGDAGINGDTSNSGNRSMFTFGGGVQVISPEFDLSGSNAASLDYWWRRGDDAFSENPDRNEDFTVQYLDDRNRWQDIETQPGEGTPGEIGTTEFELPADALHANFRFRFRQERGSNGNFDYWHVDDVVLRDQSFTCAPDDFNRGSLGPDWTTTRSRGSFSPQIVNGRLRMTEASGNQATAASFQRQFPGADNLIQVEFDYYAYGGSGADGLAVVFSDASVTPQAGGYGGSLGYAQEPNGSGGFAGGWLGVGLDEYGNFSNNNEGRNGGNNGRTLDSVAIRGAAPNYAYIADSGSLSPGIDSNNDSNPFRYRITIDSRNNQTPELTVERNGRGTGGRFELLIQETLNSQPAIPENLLFSLTGSTGGATNIHELDNLQICAEKVGPAQQRVDHFELVHSGTALTCQEEVVTIRACDNADCSQTFNDPVDVTLSPSSGWVGGNTFTMTGGTATRTLRVTSPSTVTLDVPSSSPGTKPFSQTLCDDGSSGGLSSSKCDLTFVESGFIVTAPDHISDTNQSATIAAVEASATNPEQCVPGFDNETKDVALWSSYINPGSGTRSLFADGTALPTSAGATRSLAFDGNGVATVQIRYPDVGEMRLNARYEGSGNEAGLVMTGNGDFIVRPDRFSLDIPGNPAATSVADGNDFVAAGENFDITVSALNASGNVTPNFGQESPNEGVELTRQLVLPAGGNLPALSGAFGNFGEDCSGNSSTAGTACGAFSWPEVGILELTPELISGSYLGTNDVVGTVVDHVGRFVPDRFEVVVDHGEVSPFCEVASAFAYSGQNLSWRTEPSFVATAVNVAGATTENFTRGNFQRLTSGSFNRTAGTADEAQLDSAGSPYPVTPSLDPGNWSVAVPGAGQLQYVFATTDRISYDKTVNSRVQPFTPDYLIDVTDLEDADGVSAAGLPIAINPVFAFEMRYGRMALSNAYGPETFDLEIPFQVDYFDAAGEFALHTDDSCWSYNTGDVTLTENLSGGSTSVDAATGTLASGQPAAGSELVLTAPGQSNTGNVNVNYPVPLWLQGDYDNDGTLESPESLATFGVYRGHDRVIFWGED